MKYQGSKAVILCSEVGRIIWREGKLGTGVGGGNHDFQGKRGGGENRLERKRLKTQTAHLR